MYWSIASFIVIFTVASCLSQDFAATDVDSSFAKVIFDTRSSDHRKFLLSMNEHSPSVGMLAPLKIADQDHDQDEIVFPPHALVAKNEVSLLDAGGPSRISIGFLSGTCSVKTGCVNLGLSVYALKDINGDGISDMLIGAGGGDYSGADGNKGCVWVLFGGSNNFLTDINLNSLSPSQGIKIGYLTGSPPAFTKLGAVVTCEDMNGDGIADMIIGDTATFIIYGSKTLSNIDLNTLTAAQGFALAGGMNVAAKDVNGDGYTDLLVGDSGFRDTTNQGAQGRAYLLYGGPNLQKIRMKYFATTNTVTSPNGANNTIQGIAIGALTAGCSWCGIGSAVDIGDVNGDGIPDMIIGAAGYTSAWGIVYVVYGSSILHNVDLNVLNPSQGFSMSYKTGNYASTALGITVAAGDVNGDGYADVYVGAGQQYVYLIYGGRNLVNIDLTKLTPAQGIRMTFPASSIGNLPMNCIGCRIEIGSFVSMADVNQDGYVDILIGGTKTNGNQGGAWLVYGGASLTDMVLTSLTDTQGMSFTSASGFCAGCLIGSGVSIGDVNADGKPDLLIGASGYKSNAGNTWVIFGGNALTSVDFYKAPTAIPTVAPSTAMPSTAAPSFSPNEIAELQCTPYSLTNTNNVTSNNYVTCSFIACQGYLVQLSMCESDTYQYGTCSGDSVLSVYDNSNTLLASNDDYCGSCSWLSFIVSSPSCQVFRIHQGCKGTGTCGGTVVVKLLTVIPTIAPTKVPTWAPTKTPSFVPTRAPTKSPTTVPTIVPSAIPTVLPTETPTVFPTFAPTGSPTVFPTSSPSTAEPSEEPTAEPSFSPSDVPTATPTIAPTTIAPSFAPSRTPTIAPSFASNLLSTSICAPYIATVSNNATVKYSTCTFLACHGVEIQASLCAAETFGLAECTGQTSLLVYDSFGALVSTTNGSCGNCAKVSFIANGDCQLYSIQESCFGEGSCGGTVAVSTYWKNGF